MGGQFTLLFCVFRVFFLFLIMCNCGYVRVSTRALEAKSVGSPGAGLIRSCQICGCWEVLSSARTGSALDQEAPLQHLLKMY